jgi:response regulator RpfG family c-di-GMP phosphodiesterase
VNSRVLIVDDSTELLASIRRSLRSEALELDVAEGGEAGLELVRQRGPYAVVVSDMQMPHMNGVEFLSRVKQLAPDTVRVMLTGNADQRTAVDAVNNGHIFRFLNKPCATAELIQVLRAAGEQYRLLTAEKELLNKTLTGSVKLLVDVLSLVNPAGFSRAWRVRRMTRQLAERLLFDCAWECEIAAMLAKIGHLTLEDSTLRKMQNGQSLTVAEQQSVRHLPETARNLIANIPRLEGVANIVKYQDKYYDGSGFPADDARGDAIPCGARLLKLVNDFDALLAAGDEEQSALGKIRAREGCYDPKMVVVLEQCLQTGSQRVVRTVPLGQLREGDVLAEHVEDQLGYVLVSKGHEVTPSILARLKHSAEERPIREPIRVVDWFA